VLYTNSNMMANP